MFNLKAELTTRFLSPEFCQAIAYPFTRVKFDDEAIEDVYDGSIYPDDLQLGQLHGLGSSDGIRVFKTSVNELWLVMLVILELPPSIRFVIFCV